jgi:hypothetical protein
VSELAGTFDMSLAAISKHIMVMEAAGLINKARSGRVRRCSIDFDSLKEASSVIDEYGKFWSAQLSSLEDYVQDAGDISPKEAVMAQWFFAGDGWMGCRSHLEQLLAGE